MHKDALEGQPKVPEDVFVPAGNIHHCIFLATNDTVPNDDIITDLGRNVVSMRILV